MTILSDMLYVASFAVAGPVIDYFVLWPAFRRRSQVDPARARTWLWAWTIGSAWVLVGAGAAVWLASDRSWLSFGFFVPDGWRLWVSAALLLLLAAYQAYAVGTLARNSDARASVRQQMGKLASVDVVTPHTRTELYWWGGVSLTAGFSEEFSTAAILSGSSPPGSAGGAPRLCPFCSSLSGIRTRDGMASSAQDLSAPSSR